MERKPIAKLAAFALAALIAVAVLWWLSAQAGFNQAGAPMAEKEPPSPMAEKELPSPVDSLLQELKLGAVIFRAPDTLQQDSVATAELLLKPAVSIEEVRQRIEESGIVETAEVHISDRMEARLEGQAFDVTAISSERQAVSAVKPTLWEWEIAARESGRHTLHVTLDVLLEVNDHDIPRSVRTFSRTVTVVAVEPGIFAKLGNFVSNNWKWLWAAVIFPVGLEWWRRRMKRSDENSETT